MSWLIRISSNEIFVEQAMSAIPSYFPPDLRSEIQYHLELFEELPASPFLMLYQAVFDIEDLEGIPNKWTIAIRSWLIEIGVYREITRDEIERTLVSGGRRYDFKMQGKFYVFNSHPEGFM